MARKTTISIDIECQLDRKYFGLWDDLTYGEKAVFDDKHTRCDGSGTMGSWCRACVFCEDYEEFSDE